MNRAITYIANKATAGNFAGQIVVVKPPHGRIRYSVGGLTARRPAPGVRTWETDTGQRLAVDLWVDEKEIGLDHWSAAEAAIRSHFPDTPITYID